MLRIEKVPTLKSRGLQLPFNQERAKVEELAQQLSKDKATFKAFAESIRPHTSKFTSQALDPDSAVCFPAERRLEVEVVKKAMQDYKEKKQERAFITKRNRQIKSGWKDGILGVEQPGDRSYFYSDKQLQLERARQERQMRRTANLQEKFGPSSQIQFYP